MAAVRRMVLVGMMIAGLGFVAAGPVPAAAASTVPTTTTPASSTAQTLSEAVADAAAAAADQSVTTAISVVDRNTGAVLAQTANAQTPFASESIMKLFLAAYYLVQDGGYTNAPATLTSQLSFMLRYSDDDTATALFTADAIPTIAARYGLKNTTNATDDPGHWGAARITAADMTRFLYAASQDPEVGPWLLQVLSQTAPTGSGSDSGFSQAFGLNALTGDHGSKQGWGCDSYWTSSPCVINSVGYTDHTFVAVLQVGDGYPDPMRATATDAAGEIQQATDQAGPVGNLDSVTNPSPGDLTVVGWAADPAAAGQPESVQIEVTGPAGSKEFDGTSTGGPRTDVAAANPWAGVSTGFSAVVAPQGAGSNQVCAYALEVNPPHVRQSVGCRTVAVNDAFGSVDAVVPREDQFVVSGWALNPNSPTGQVQIQVTDADQAGSVSYPPIPAGDDRPDVGAADPGYGPEHGFEAVIPLLAAGTQTVCVSAIAAGGGTGNAQLGCRAVTVDPAQAYGSLDSVSVAGGRITAAGWAQDPNDPGAQVGITAYDTSAAGTSRYTGYLANADEPDFTATIVPSDGSDHRYSATIPTVAPGPNSVCVYATGSASATGSDLDGDNLLGCQTVSGDSPPRG